MSFYTQAAGLYAKGWHFLAMHPASVSQETETKLSLAFIDNTDLCLYLSHFPEHFI